MTRVASLCLPQLPIERLRRSERPATPPEGWRLSVEPRLPMPIDDDPGACSVPRGGGWRPGARWARDGALGRKPGTAQIDAPPAHQRPTMREMGRRSQSADHPFKAMAPDDGAPGSAPIVMPTWSSLWGRPTILITRVGQRDIVASACPAALELGLRPGMAAAHARALVTDLEVHDAEPDMDHALLDRLALHAVGRWTPTASVAPPDGLWLDLTGTTHLFGGEMRFCRRLLGFLKRLGFTARVAIAGTPGAAHALARYGGEAITILPPGQESQAIAELPLPALRLSPEALLAAGRFGLERIGDLYPMPRGPLAKRLGLKTVERLDQARGGLAEPIIPVVPFEAPKVERRLLEPIGTADSINHVIGDLVDDLVGVLQARGLGVRAAVLTCLVVDGGEQRIPIGTARATRDARHLKRMFAMRVERIYPGLGIEEMRMIAPRVEPLQPEALDAGFGDGNRAPDIAPLVDQLGGRVGEEALFRVGSVESDVPERGACRLGPLAAPQGWPAWKRPVRLLSPPELLSNVVALLPDHPPRRFNWRGSAYRVVAGDGPERIHGEWWRNAREMWAVRDYFRVEAEGGNRFWIFRRGDGVEAPTGDLKGEAERAQRADEDARAIPFLKRFTVFNVAQCEGLRPGLAADPVPLPEREIVPVAEALIKASKADFRIGGDKAFYVPSADFVQVPPQPAFYDQINYYRTALHELTHWTGHASRLARDFTGSFGSKPYAREELTAEMGSAFLCAALGIEPTVRHADYLGHWLDVLREDNRAIFRAASAASKAADYLLAVRDAALAEGREAA